MGLSVDEPKRLDPRVLVFDVPCRVTDETLLRSVYEKNVSELMSADALTKRTRVGRRFGKEGADVSNVIVELPLVCPEKLLRDGRVYADWCSYKLCPYEKVPRCFKCMGYGHRLNKCKSERLCWRCAKSGHATASCRAPEDCVNCRVRKLPSGHSAMSPACPEYEWRLGLLTSHFSNG